MLGLTDMRLTITHAVPLPTNGLCLKSEHSIQIVGIALHTRSAPFGLFWGAGPSAKEPGERQIPVLYCRVCSPHFSWLFHQLNGTKEPGPWAVGAAGAPEMY